ncbi:hypothetical protein [Alistipes sp.]
MKKLLLCVSVLLVGCSSPFSERETPAQTVIIFHDAPPLNHLPAGLSVP